MPADYRHISKLIRPAPAITLGDAVLKWYDIAPADEPVPSRCTCLRARNSARSGRVGSARLVGRARLRDPAPLRRELLLPHRLDLAQRQRALGDGVGEGRRRRGLLPARGRSRGRTARRSACGSSARSGTSSRRGAASSARRAEHAAREAYLATRSRVRCSCRSGRSPLKQPAPARRLGRRLLWSRRSLGRGFGPAPASLHSRHAEAP